MENKREMNFFELLILLYRAMINGFKLCLNFILRLIRFSIQNIVIIVLSVGLSVMLCLFFTRASKQIIKAEATLSFLPQTYAYVTDGIDLLQSYCSSGNKEALSSLLNLPDSVVGRIQSFSYYNVIDSKRDSVPNYVDYERHNTWVKDTNEVSMNDRVVLRVQARNLNDFTNIKSGVKQFLTEQPQVKAIYTSYMGQMKERVAYCDKEMIRIDSLSNYQYFTKQNRFKLQLEKTMILTDTKQQVYYDYSNELLEWKFLAESMLAKYEQPVAFVTDFKVIKPVRIKQLVLSVFFGYLSGLILALLFVYRKAIIDFLKKK